MHANSLANLKPPWQPGESGCRGRKTAGVYVSEWLNQLVGRTREQVEAGFADESAEVAKRIAAARVLRAMRLDAEGDRATELVCDRTAGRPVQAVVNITADVADLGAVNLGGEYQATTQAIMGVHEVADRGQALLFTDGKG